jgi:hypothetical protein
MWACGCVQRGQPLNPSVKRPPSRLAERGLRASDIPFYQCSLQQLIDPCQHIAAVTYITCDYLGPSLAALLRDLLPLAAAPAGLTALLPALTGGEAFCCGR